MARRKDERWTEETARAELKRWRASGLTVAEHCRRRGIQTKKLYRWRHRLGMERVRQGGGTSQEGDTSAMQWVEATITSGRLAAAVTVTIGDGSRIEIERPGEVDAVWLGTLVTKLRAGA